jgi:peptidylprolyl isomerase
VTTWPPFARRKAVLSVARLMAITAMFMIATGSSSARAEFDPTKHDLENIIYLELKNGRVVIKTYPEDAPMTVARVKELVRQGFYNGLTFHRVLPEFMAQTGDPRGDGSGGSGQDLKAEFNKRHHLRGTVSMARGQGEDSADSQFFIMFLPKFGLDGEYTVWGRVIDGMSNVDAIKKGSPGFHDGEVINPDKIKTMSVAADVENIQSSPGAYSTPQYNPIAAPTPVAPVAPAYVPQPVTPTYQPYVPRAVPPARAPSVPQSTPSKATGGGATRAPQVPLPKWPIEPPHYETVFPPIPQGGYVPY